MRSDLSKSLKLNSVESGCLGGESREERSGGGRIRGGEEGRSGVQRGRGCKRSRQERLDANKPSRLENVPSRRRMRRRREARELARQPDNSLALSAFHQQGASSSRVCQP